MCLKCVSSVFAALTRVSFTVMNSIEVEMVISEAETHLLTVRQSVILYICTFECRATIIQVKQNYKKKTQLSQCYIFSMKETVYLCRTQLTLFIKKPQLEVNGRICKRKV